MLLSPHGLITHGENKDKGAQVLCHPLMVLGTRSDGQHQNLRHFCRVIDILPLDLLLPIKICNTAISLSGSFANNRS